MYGCSSAGCRLEWRIVVRLFLPRLTWVSLSSFSRSTGDMGVGKSCLLHQFTEKKCKCPPARPPACLPWVLTVSTVYVRLDGSAWVALDFFVNVEASGKEEECDRRLFCVRVSCSLPSPFSSAVFGATIKEPDAVFMIHTPASHPAHTHTQMQTQEQFRENFQHQIQRNVLLAVLILKIKTAVSKGTKWHLLHFQSCVLTAGIRPMKSHFCVKSRHQMHLSALKTYQRSKTSFFSI